MASKSMQYTEIDADILQTEARDEYDAQDRAPNLEIREGIFFQPSSMLADRDVNAALAEARGEGSRHRAVIIEKKRMLIGHLLDELELLGNNTLIFFWPPGFFGLMSLLAITANTELLNVSSP